MNSTEIRQKYLDFFKTRGHVILPSASLLPENDPTTLFTGSGMQPLIPYLLGAQHPSGNRLVNSQKCFRAEDIEEIGDNRHTTFFEMLGNWSLGDYFKAEQLPWFWEFLTKTCGIDPDKLYVSVFAGEESLGIPKDEESVKIWQQLYKEVGIEAKDVFMGSVEDGSHTGMQGGRIFYYDAKKNWWSRAGVPSNMPTGEPGGPDSEVFYDFGTEHNPQFGEQCHPNCDCGRFMEIGNSVFMEYLKNEDGSFSKLKQRNVDFGGGLERIASAANKNGDVFLSNSSLVTIIDELEKLSGQKYSSQQQPSFRVIADHIRGATFMIADGVHPSNTDQGYFVRRLIRRAVRHADLLGMPEGSLAKLVLPLVKSFAGAYGEIVEREVVVVDAIFKEENKFRETLSRGLKEFEKMATSAAGNISSKDAFDLYQSYGFPLEMTIELAKEKGLMVDTEGYKQEFAKHQDASRTAAAGKFKGGLLDHSAETTRLHTATHLLHATLRKVLGDHVFQKGSNITPERLRFDFSHPEKVTPEQIKKVEDMINEVVGLDLPVSWREMSYDEAQKEGALGLFESKYGEKVKVYSIGDYSKEVCGGPHVNHTAEVGQFKILKEEAISGGVRRIKAVVS